LVQDAIPATVETSFSRYEVLNGKYRTVYFDLDGIPDDENAENVPDEFVHAWFAFMKKSKFIKGDDIKYVRTKNHSSPTHKGFSSHVICYELQMNIYDLRDSVIMFGLTEEGQKFKDFVDTCVYSKVRLFKLPNFIGIPMDDPNNYHHLDERDPDFTHYIIQIYYDFNRPRIRINARFSVPEEARKAATIRSRDDLTAIINQFKEITQAIADPQQHKLNKEKEKVDKLIKGLMENSKVSEHDKELLRKFVERKRDDPLSAKGLCRIIMNKNNLTEDDVIEPENYDL
jgi:ferredoxin-thioredoxin reductase catalytic subunit